MRSKLTVANSEFLLPEWDYAENAKNGKKPDDVTLGSGYIASWICPKGHKYPASVNSRHRGSGCPYCCNKKALAGFNDLESQYPEIAKDWHSTKNGDLKPSDVTYGSGKKVWWICPFKHEYQKVVRDKVRGQGCSVCAKALKTSFPEQAIFYYIRKGFPDAINGYKDIFDNGMELDVFIPSINVGIEYDGSAYHGKKRLAQDNQKYNICRQKGIILIRIQEYSQSGQWRLYNKKIEIPNAKDENLNYAISTLCYKLGQPQDVNVSRDRFEILQYLQAKRTSLKDEFPDVAAEWDYEKNRKLLPEQFAAHANNKVYWICKDCGNRWFARISERTRSDGRASGCPNCNNKKGRNAQIDKKIKESGSLAEVYPDLMKEWDYSKNDIDPDTILPSSSKSAWWICSKCGYNWKTKVLNRTSKGHGCRLCSNQDTVKGINDLTTTRPDLLLEWDYKKNEKGPEYYSEHSNKKVNWKCSKCGYEWPAAINMRSRGHGCPCCSGRVPLVGVNDLKTLRPDIADDWDYEHNSKGPECYKVHSKASALWKCKKCGYCWENKISNRTRNPGCPNCKKNGQYESDD